MRTLSFAVVFAATFALAAPAEADCIDHLHCICPAVVDVSATGTIENVRTEMTEDGFAIDIGELRIERISLRDEVDMRFAEGQLVDVNVQPNARQGDRLLVFAHPGDESLTLLSRIDGGNVSCSGALFTEHEALEMIVSPDCRDTARERIEIPPCDDTVSFGDCTIGNDLAGRFPWWLIALAPILRRRRSRAQSQTS